MTEWLPYLSGIVTVFFGIGFFLSLQQFKEFGEEVSKEDQSNKKEFD